MRDLSTAKPRDITLDHHVPRALNGTNESSNLYTACRDCNQKHHHEARSRSQIRRVIAHMHKPLTPFLDAAAVLVAMKKTRYHVT